MVSHVTEDNKGIALAITISPSTLFVYDSDSGVLKLEGEPIAATWYAEDGTTVLSGANYPATVHYGSTISDFRRTAKREAVPPCRLVLAQRVD